MTLEQMSIALAKLYSGTAPGDDMWCELDYEALEYALGHPVERKPTQFDDVPPNCYLLDKCPVRPAELVLSDICPITPKSRLIGQVSDNTVLGVLSDICPSMGVIGHGRCLRVIVKLLYMFCSTDTASQIKEA